MKLIRVVVRHKLIFATISKNTISPSLFVKTLKFFSSHHQSGDGRRLKEALIELGPVYIKLGQLLSTRGDLLPKEIIFELSQLQDTVPILRDFEIGSFVASQNFSKEQTIRDIDPTPIASASIAQIYSGHLEDGTKVILKVVRTGIEKEIRRNMALLKLLALKVDKWLPSCRRFHLPKLMRDHEEILLRELDMHSESRNQIQLRRNFAGSDLLYVPESIQNTQGPIS